MHEHYAVFGHPIGHSLSPHIHSLFAQQTGQTSMNYTAQDVNADQFKLAADAFFSAGGKGLNCTVPLKQLAFDVCDQASERAQPCGAVNTLAMRSDGVLFGDNTDGIGLIRDLTQNLGVALKDAKILLLGAGGASRGILGPLLEQQPSELTIANRTIDKGIELASAFARNGPVTACSFSDLSDKIFDLIINATTASLGNEIPPLPNGILTDGGYAYDLAYAAEATAFVRWGLQQGATVSADGLGMLVEQAAEAFLIWRDIRPESGPVIERLEKRRKNSATSSVKNA